MHLSYRTCTWYQGAYSTGTSTKLCPPLQTPNQTRKRISQLASAISYQLAARSSHTTDKNRLNRRAHPQSIHSLFNSRIHSSLTLTLAQTLVEASLEIPSQLHHLPHFCCHSHSVTQSLSHPFAFLYKAYKQANYLSLYRRHRPSRNGKCLLPWRQVPLPKVRSCAVANQMTKKEGSVVGEEALVKYFLFGRQGFERDVCKCTVKVRRKLLTFLACACDCLALSTEIFVTKRLAHFPVLSLFCSLLLSLGTLQFLLISSIDSLIHSFLFTYSR